MSRIAIYANPIKVTGGVKIMFPADINTIKSIDIVGEETDGNYVKLLGKISFPEFEVVEGKHLTWGQLDAIKGVVLSELKKAELNRIAEVVERWGDEAPSFALKPSSRWKEYNLNFQTIKIK